MKRIFWLGMHKLLVRTELVRLRSLGYEVFNPPYLSPIYDQSANLNWNREQPTTLPPEVFEQLSTHNFFYNSIPEHISELLNTYFDVVIVTINPDWLTEIIKVYKGRLIYRTYGQTYLLSEYLWNNGAARLILDHPDFTFVPFHERSADPEHTWLLDRMQIVPYQIDDDIIDIAGTYEKKTDPRIVLTCPNIDNNFYHGHYRYLKRHFAEEHFKFYGVQPRAFGDRQIVGTLAREELKRHYQTASGYLYTHGGPMVCYLPPIEMMTIGGPVITLPHNLLARMLPPGAPGIAENEDIARQHCRRLVENDTVFSKEIIASQTEVAEKYHPNYVNPIFDRTFRALLSSKEARSSSKIIVDTNFETEICPVRKRFYIFFHFPGSIVGRRDNEYYSAEGIPRVARLMVDGILSFTDYEVVVTTTYGNAPHTIGFFGIHPEGRLKVLVVDSPPAIRSHQVQVPSLLERTSDALRKRWRYWSFHNVPDVAQRLRESLGRLGSGVRRALGRRIAQMFPKKHGPLVLPTDVAQTIDRDPQAIGAIIPHYFLFPEAARLQTPFALYLPDYIPHFYKDGDAFPNQVEPARVGKSLCQRAEVIITNSEFTRSYLPETELEVQPDKIRVFPLPNLNVAKAPAEPNALTAVQNHVSVFTRNRQILFYPTQNRPNKNIAFLLTVFAGLIRDWDELGRGAPMPILLLTCSLDDFQPVRTTCEKLQLQEHIVLASGATDHDLRWMYKQAAALVLTTTMEGNFPPQVLEALSYDTPVVASRIPLITDELGDHPDDILLADPLSEPSFREAILKALQERERVVQRQKKAYHRLMEKRSVGYFGARMAEVVKALEDEHQRRSKQHSA